MPTISIEKQQRRGHASALPTLRDPACDKQLACRHAFSSSRRVSPELCLVSLPSDPRGRREGRVPAGTRGLLRERHAQKRPHSSIQVSPITRPSLRDGWTAYAVISREPTIPSGLPRPANLDDAVCPVGLARTFAKDLTVATTARTTRFCRTHGPPCRRSIPELRRQSRKLTDETKPDSAVVRTRLRTHRDYPPCPHLSCRRCRVHRNPGSRT